MTTTYDKIANKFSGQAAIGVTCWCSIRFAVPQTLYDFYERRNEEQPGSFGLTCPLGHGMVPAGKTKAQREAEQLRDELAGEKHRAEQARADAEYQRTQRQFAERRVAASKGQLTKIKNRVGNGVCPCCNRYFANLHRHMTTQHPGWSPEAEGAPEGTAAPSPAPRPMEPITVNRAEGDWRLSRDWRKMAARRRGLGVSLDDAAQAVGLKVSTLRFYESQGGALSTAKRYANYLNEKLGSVSTLSERGPNDSPRAGNG